MKVTGIYPTGPLVVPIHPTSLMDGLLGSRHWLTSGNVTVNRTRQKSCPHGCYIPEKKIDTAEATHTEDGILRILWGKGTRYHGSIPQRNGPGAGVGENLPWEVPTSLRSEHPLSGCCLCPQWPLFIAYLLFTYHLLCGNLPVIPDASTVSLPWSPDPPARGDLYLL